ncbi:disulfide bond formation protein DsbD [Flavobacterium akiainvivens]|uniref:Disulfide bond formation protein DsbD n=1 Tax=Flavobacterium akiainvivens TaxID=1202724 RepID=A0A0M8M7T6_9FLAO|nr:thioredoxin family protein [Flavobacterium akiainvivens]KOS05213.1 disulfide bond formation protein DsbD [Flavobacterium akiainvivens]SFQ50588.1 Thiol:disulfide interchange protein DsbD [Flavobacterium akiainvivens]
MKKFGLLLLLIVSFAGTYAQGVKHPVKWTSKIEKKSDTEYVLVFNAVIEESWHMYSQFTPDGGALPMVITFNNQKGNYTLVGKTQESKTEKAFNDIFEVDEYFWSHTAQLKQTVKLAPASNKVVQVTLDYQVCKESCIQDGNLFEFDLAKMASKEVKNFKNIPLAVLATDPPAGAQPVEATVTDTVKATDTAKTQVVPAPKDETAKPDVKAAKDEEKGKDGLFTIFFVAFLSGFAALLTPCVFPMIPMTVSFFTKQSKSKAAGVRNAITYGISIIVIYVLLGSLVTGIFGADSLNALSTNVAFNLIFFVLLIVFACSFLGAFEIMLPNSWANKVDRQADRGGIIGILFMALALAIVSFSCTGPIVGTLLVEAASKGGLAPVIGMFGFSLALALPFMLFAMFPGWLNSLPKSGGWLNTVKVFLGFLELALAFKFLSNADLVLQLHYLERETFLAIWIAVFGALALYMFGKIKMPHDTPGGFISVGRLLLGLLVLSFTIYLIPGLWGAPLKLISGFPPSQTYSESPFGFGGSSGVTTAVALPEGAHSGPQGIAAFEDYDKALAYAKKTNKPLLIDFTGYACVNCRKMEDNVWSDKRILSVLNNDVVLVSLYVDFKEELPESEQYISETTGKHIKTIGNKWSDMQIRKYKTNSQPYYVLVNNKEENLNEPVGYTPDIEEYLKWLQEGVANYKK